MCNYFNTLFSWNSLTRLVISELKRIDRFKFLTPNNIQDLFADFSSRVLTKLSIRTSF